MNYQFIFIYRSNSIGEEGAKSIGFGLQQLTNLTSLTINL
jgi:hypothetical protein